MKKAQDALMKLYGSVVVFTLFFAFSAACPAAARMKESVYQVAWCASHGGLTEVVLEDRTRVDCVTSVHAVEVDFAPKWAEAIGQALYYAMRTGRTPGILLIMESERDARFLERLMAVTGSLGIEVWTITPEDVSGNDGEPRRR